MKAQEFDQLFDQGEEIIHLLDLSQAKRRNANKTTTININTSTIERISGDISIGSYRSWQPEVRQEES